MPAAKYDWETPEGEGEESLTLFSFLLFCESFVTDLAAEVTGCHKKLRTQYDMYMQDDRKWRRRQIGSVRLLCPANLSSYNPQMFYCFLLSN